MVLNSLPRATSLAVAVVVLMSGRASVGQISSNLDANVQAYFTGSSDANQFSKPTGLTPWAAAGAGPYPATGVTNVPSPPSSPLYPSLLTPSSSFVGSSTTYFSDGTAIASSTIYPQLLSGGTYVTNGSIQGGLDLINPTTSYAYEQLNFEADYFANGPMGGVDPIVLPNFLALGTITGANAYAQLGGKLEFWWALTDASPGHPVLGSWVSLGSLDYDWSINNGANTGSTGFSQFVQPLGTSSLYALSTTPSGPGILAITGEVFVAGDPSEIHVTTTAAPEPASCCLALAGFGSLTILYRRRMKRPRG